MATVCCLAPHGLLNPRLASVPLKFIEDDLVLFRTLLSFLLWPGGDGHRRGKSGELNLPLGEEATQPMKSCRSGKSLNSEERLVQFVQRVLHGKLYGPTMKFTGNVWTLICGIPFKYNMNRSLYPFVSKKFPSRSSRTWNSSTTLSQKTFTVNCLFTPLQAIRQPWKSLQPSATGQAIALGKRVVAGPDSSIYCDPSQLGFSSDINF